MAERTGLLDADKMDLMLLLRDQRRALCAIARGFGWPSEDWTLERLADEAARLHAIERAAVEVVRERARPVIEPSDMNAALLGLLKAIGIEALGRARR